MSRMNSKSLTERPFFRGLCSASPWTSLDANLRLVEAVLAEAWAVAISSGDVAMASVEDVAMMLLGRKVSPLSAEVVLMISVDVLLTISSDTALVLSEDMATIPVEQAAEMML